MQNQPQTQAPKWPWQRFWRWLCGDNAVARPLSPGILPIDCRFIALVGMVVSPFIALVLALSLVSDTEKINALRHMSDLYAGLVAALIATVTLFTAGAEHARGQALRQELQLQAQIVQLAQQQAEGVAQPAPAQQRASPSPE